MQLQDVEKKRQLPDGRIQLNVNNHKTRATYGSARIYLSQETYDQLLTWVQHVRPMLVKNDDVQCVFVNGNGKPLTNSVASKQF